MVIVFGSINLDLVFRVPILPGPGQTVSGPDYLCVPGGKGANQALAAARAGSEVVLVGAVGDDSFASIATHLLREGGVDLSRVLTNEAPTGCAAVCVDAHAENQIVVASGANAFAKQSGVDDTLLVRSNVLVLQNEVPTEENLQLARRARARGTRVLWNAAPAKDLAPDALGSIDLLIVNADEASWLASTLGMTVDTPSRVARALSNRCGPTVVVTCGSLGSVAATNDVDFEIPCLAVQAVDSTGAGDAFVGVLASAIDRGVEFAEALAQASVAGALACQAPGAQSALPTAAAIHASRPRLGPIASHPRSA